MRINSLFILVLIVFTGCSVQKYSTKGKVNPDQFHVKVPFTTHKGVIGLEVDVNGVTKNLLFDTGADLSLIQQDEIDGAIAKVSGASGRKVELGSGVVPSIKIDEVEFIDTYALNGDLQGLKEQIPDFGGIIGQSVIRKANWLIDYPNHELEFSNKNLVDDRFKEIEIIRDKVHNPYTYIEVNGKAYKVIIDLGSSSTINLPSDSEFAKDVSSITVLSDSTRERYTLGGLQKINEKVGQLSKVSLGEFELENVDFNINESSQPRIGINFFKDFQIYIDNTNDVYRLYREED